jgi:hypothetical protein
MKWIDFTGSNIMIFSEIHEKQHGSRREFYRGRAGEERWN